MNDDISIIPTYAEDAAVITLIIMDSSGTPISPRELAKTLRAYAGYLDQAPKDLN